MTTEPVPGKHCTQCGEDKSAEAFHLDNRRGGLRSWCKDCEKHYQQRRREQQRAAAPLPVMERPCPCGSGLIVRRTMQKNRGEKLSPGRWPACSSCHEASQAASRQSYHETHREQHIAYNKQYRLDNQEAVRAYGRERARKARQDNPKLLKARYQAWYLQLRSKILAHYGTVCACCGGTSYLGIDHLDGNGREHREEIFGNHRFGGGPNFWLWLVENDFPDGYQILCRSCNRSKGAGTSCTLNHGRPAA